MVPSTDVNEKVKDKLKLVPACGGHACSNSAWEAEKGGKHRLESYILNAIAWTNIQYAVDYR